MRLFPLIRKSNSLTEKTVKSFRLLLVAPQPLYEDRGTPIVILEELKCLSSLGIAVDVLTYPLGQDISLNGVSYIRIKNLLRFMNVPVGFSWRKVLLDIQLTFKAFQLVTKKKYDCLHGVEEGALICTIFKWLYAIPLIYDMHSSIPEQLTNRLFFRKGPGLHLAKLIEKILIKNAQVIMASKGLAPLICSIKPQSDIKEWIFDYCPACDDSDDLANQMGIQNRPVVAYIGNFAHYQGVELLIEAILKVRDTINDIVLLLVGGTASEIANLEKKVNSLNLTDNVILVQRVSRDQVPLYFSMAGVLSLPRPRGENAPLKIYEYEKSGKPIVATNIPAHKLIANNPNSVIVRPNVDSLANGIIAVLKEKKPFSENSDQLNQECLPNTQTLPTAIKAIYMSLIDAQGVNP
jgi:glycosyltransferase involved in cell wall biosynthesis